MGLASGPSPKKEYVFGMSDKKLVTTVAIFYLWRRVLLI